MEHKTQTSHTNDAKVYDVIGTNADIGPSPGTSQQDVTEPVSADAESDVIYSKPVTRQILRQSEKASRKSTRNSSTKKLPKRGSIKRKLSPTKSDHSRMKSTNRSRLKPGPKKKALRHVTKTAETSSPRKTPTKKQSCPKRATRRSSNAMCTSPTI